MATLITTVPLLPSKRKNGSNCLSVPWKTYRSEQYEIHSYPGATVIIERREKGVKEREIKNKKARQRGKKT